MGDKLIYGALSGFVKSPKLFKAFQDYIDFRIQFLYKQLEQAQDFEEVRKIQGQIFEIRRLRGLDLIVEGELKNNG